MLSKNDVVQRDQLEMVTLDQLVPQDHLVCNGSDIDQGKSLTLAGLNNSYLIVP